MSNINLIKLKFIIIFLLTIILFPINSNSEEILIKPDDIGNYCDKFSKDFLIKKINKVNSLEINFDDDRAWIKNSIQIITSGSENILRKFKKRFKANITVNFDENVQCNFRAKIRQHGDKLDHINYRDGIPEDGAWVLTAPNEISKGTFRKGKKDGVWTYFHGFETLNLKPHNLPQDPNDFRPLLTQIWKNGKLISEEKN